MSLFPVTENNPNPETLLIFDDFKEKMGFPFVPNFMKTLAFSDESIKGVWRMLEHILLSGSLPRLTKEMILVHISDIRNCQYCKSAHLACCRMLGAEEGQIQALERGRTSPFSMKTKEILNFAVKCAMNPINVSDDDIQRLAACGVSEKEQFEIITMAGLSVFLNIVTDASKIELDPEIKQ